MTVVARFTDDMWQFDHEAWFARDSRPIAVGADVGKRRVPADVNRGTGTLDYGSRE
jgi:hypothetical protein